MICQSCLLKTNRHGSTGYVANRIAAVNLFPDHKHSHNPNPNHTLNQGH
jgi:hypothetical protein